MVSKKIKSAKKKYYEELFLSMKNNIRKTWKVINSIISNKTNSDKVSIQSLVIDGVTLTSNEDIAMAFNSHFSSVGKKIDESLPHSDENLSFLDYMSFSTPTNSFFLSPILPHEVASVIEKMDNKSTHIDTYSIKVVKYLTSIISPVLCKIINKSFEVGYFPQFCKVAKVLPLYKSGDPKDVNNYRPISLLPIFSKIFEKIVYQKLYGFLQKNNLLSNCQFGFRKKLSTLDAIIDMTQYVYDSLDRNKTVVSFFLDFSKAFDCVNHSVLLRKLEQYGVRGLANKWFSTYLNNRKQYVSVNNVLSSIDSIEYGVPQGSTLGPLLFLIFINDFASCSNFFKFTLFADDSTLTCCFDHANSELIKTELERFLIPVNQWLFANRIKVNANKSNFIIFSYRKNLKIDSINFGSNSLKQVTTTKFLGIHIDEHLSYKHHIEHIMSKISRSIGLLFKLNYFLPKNILVNLYNSLILPYFNYGIILWHNSANIVRNRIVTAQKKAIRAICKLNFNDHTNDSFKDLDILKIHDLYKLNLCATKFKQMNSPELYPISDRFLQNSNFHTYHTRNRANFSVPLYSKSHSQSCYLYQASIEFNNLPVHLKQCCSVHLFRKKFKKFLIDRY